MRDVHVHFLHGNGGGYTVDFFEGFIKVAQKAGLDEIYLLEHTHQFTKFERVFEPIKAYNDYQRSWINKNMNGSIKEYLNFIENVKDVQYPVKVKFGLEVCYIPETADILANILDGYEFDLTDLYSDLSTLLYKHGMYAENSGGLRLNYNSDLELGLNASLLSVFKKNNVDIATASDAHKQSDVGANILELENMLK